MFLVTLFFMVGVSYTDPGVIPRRWIVESKEGERERLRQVLGYDILGLTDDPLN